MKARRDTPTLHTCGTCKTAWRCEAEAAGRPCELPTVLTCSDCRGVG